jgi:hypothetical protein
VIRRFMVAQCANLWIVWDSEERMIIDEDEDCAEMACLAAAMNWLDRDLNHSRAN